MPSPTEATVEPVIVERPLPYVDRLEVRLRDTITTIVMHCTELPDLAMAREYGERVVYASGTGNSGHYYIDRDGRIERWVPDNRVAHHVRDCNRASLGIELVNTGRWPDWHDSRRQVPVESYTTEQIDALIALLVDLRRRFPNLVDMAGHEDLDRTQVEASDDAGVLVQRKVDPGPLFPWQLILDGSGLHRISAVSG